MGTPCSAVWCVLGVREYTSFDVATAYNYSTPIPEHKDGLTIDKHFFQVNHSFQ